MIRFYRMQAKLTHNPFGLSQAQSPETEKGNARLFIDAPGIKWYIWYILLFDLDHLLLHFKITRKLIFYWTLFYFLQILHFTLNGLAVVTHCQTKAGTATHWFHPGYNQARWFNRYINTGIFNFEFILKIYYSSMRLGLILVLFVSYLSVDEMENIHNCFIKLN